MSDEMIELTLEGKIRKDILTAAHGAGKVGAHIAPSLSLVEICLAVFENYDSSKDVFVLSKAHGALGYYAAMHQLGMITDEQFASFEQNGGEFPGQPSRSPNNCIDYSGGSLGMGLSYAAGRAWSSPSARIFVILGDGELDEGSNWEAASVISKNKLTNICAIVDWNGLQSDGKCDDILNKDLPKIWDAHGWNTVICNGHDTRSLSKIMKETVADRPMVILAKTIKGRGVSFMENSNEWHHHELKDVQYMQAISELKENYGLRKK